MYPSAHRFAHELERSLGDPRNPALAMSFERAVQFDEKEEMPLPFLTLLRDMGAHYLLIPEELGGSLCSFEESMLVLRLIARRDLTAAIAFGQTFLGAIPVWLAGSEPQKQALASCIREGQLGCLALTEEEHGGDLAATEFRAIEEGGGYVLSGRKWLINNGAHGGTITVLARTAESGFSSLSLFFIERRRLAGTGLLPLEKIRTHGIRGADISGFECRELRLPGSAIVGDPGRGHEITLKTLQISRTLCAALSLGAADTALRTALGFALERRVFGAAVADIPSAREQLTGAYTDLLICDCLSIAASRALQGSVDRMPLWSSIVKYLVPTMVEDLIREAAMVLGARHYIRQDCHSGIFQKCMRDNAVVSLFDGSTAVNLHIIAGQLSALANRHRALAEEDGAVRLASVFGIDTPLPWHGFPQASQMKFTNNGCDEVVEGLLAAVGNGLPERFSGLARQLADEVELLDRELAKAKLANDLRTNSPARFALAKRYCVIHAGAACLMLWMQGRKSEPNFAARSDWLEMSLHLLLARLRPNAEPVSAEVSERVYLEMVGQFRRNELFSLMALPLGTTPADG